MHQYHPGWGWFGLLTMLLFLILLLIGVLGVIRLLVNGRSKERRLDPIDILKERYARGEIDREEFEARKRDLEK
jgi:putative membrane protein